MSEAMKKMTQSPVRDRLQSGGKVEKYLNVEIRLRNLTLIQQGLYSVYKHHG